MSVPASVLILVFAFCDVHAIRAFPAVIEDNCFFDMKVGYLGDDLVRRREGGVVALVPAVGWASLVVADE